MLKLTLMLLILATGFSAYAQPYKFFATSKAAQDFVSASSLNSSDDPYVFVKSNDPAYKTAATILKSVVEAHVKLNPEYAKLPMPQLLLVKSPADTAEAAGFDPETKTFPFIVLISKEMLADPVALQGVLAHELAHIYLKHGKVKDSSNPSNWTYVDCGNSTPLSDENFDTVQTFIEATAKLGLTDNEAFLELPNTVSIDNGYLNFLDTLVNKYNDKVCLDAKETYEGWLKSSEEGLDAAHFTFNFSNETADKVRFFSTHLSKKLHDCLANKPHISYMDLARKSWDIKKADEAFILRSMSPKERERFNEDERVFNSQPNMADGLTELIRLNKNRVEESQAKIDMTKIRFHSQEDEADILAVKALKRINVSPNGLNDFLTKEDSCGDLTNEPEYGTLLDSHHSDCWRAWRNTKLFSELSTQQ